MSGLEFLLDTNVAIGLLNGDAAARALIAERHARPSNCAVSQITRIELLSYPLMTDAAELQARRLLARLQVVLIDDLVEAAAIALRRQTRLKLPDAVIAASAQAHRLELLTFDERLRQSIKTGAA
ncbi:MAG TPA: type II toxin-antitoxin system VapC family toxin [Methylocystis sp.]|nr:type II toxin-antitoxin system VapC family toxin [Methylocystis sp.]